MNPQVVDIKEDKGLLTFTITGLNVSLINALRRILIAEIPTIVFRTSPYEKNEATFHVNTTRLNNEILKQRLSCIPIHITDNLSLEELAEYEVEIHKKNEGSNVEMVTTEDFSIKHQAKHLSSNAIQKIFPPDALTEDYILFARLRPKISEDVIGEELHITAKFSIGVAAENSAFNVVSTCAYAMTPDKTQQYDAWAKREKELRSNKYSKEDMGMAHKNWLLHDGKRIVVSNSFDFCLETIGVFKNRDLMKKATEIINAKLLNIKTGLADQQIKIARSATTLENSFDIILKNEGYTIGKIIESILYEKYYEGDRSLSYLGFIKKHPHDADGLLRMAFRDSVDHTAAANLLVNVIDEATGIFAHIHSQF